MPTEIYFAGENVRVTVDEEPAQVAEAFTSASGLPIRLTARGGDRDVYVNPSTVAFWLHSKPKPEVEPASALPAESPQSRRGREALTDVWGRPLRG